MHIGLAIQAVRKAKKVRQKEIFLNLDRVVTQQVYQKYEKYTFPRAQTVKKICTAMKVPEAAVLLYAVDEAQIPDVYREMFQELKTQIIK
jgi:transcriptional regulator with XRE-family HTH domain